MRAWRMTRGGHWLAVLAVAAALLAEALFRVGVPAPLESRLQDVWFQWRGQSGEARQVVIVAIDEETLAAFPDDPLVFWSSRLAEAVARLRAAGARVVGLDLLLGISPERWLGKLGGELRQAARDFDRPFREQANSGRLVLVATRSGDGLDEADYLLPSPDYLLALPDFDIPGHVGLGELLDDGDGVIRRHAPAPVVAAGRRPPEGSVPLLTLPALLAVHAAGLSPDGESWRIGGRELSISEPPSPIPYLGPPGSFPRLSLVDLLAGDAPSGAVAALLRDKVVLVGVTATGMNDEHFTPFATRFLSGRGPLMPGVEIHANVVEALLSGERLRPLPEWVRPIGLGLVAALAVAAFAALPLRLGALLGLASLPAFALLGYASFLAGFLLPATSFMLAAGLAFLGTLGWRLTGEERERARLRRMFSRYVSGQVVDSLLASTVRPELGGQAQTVTVLFSDIRNFTTLSERLSAKETVEMLNAYFERACVPLLAEGGSIDKFIGDAVMVEFGSPLPMPDHARRAVRAAVALARVAEEFPAWMAARFPGRDLPPFAVGIGLHSGEAVVGNIGSPARMEFTAIGDTVNLASRLEGLTKELGCTILASEATVTAAGSMAMTGRSRVVRVKGRTAAVTAYEVLGVATEVRDA